MYQTSSNKVTLGDVMHALSNTLRFLLYVLVLLYAVFTRALPDITSGPEVRQILEVQAGRKPDVFLTGPDTLISKKKSKKIFSKFFDFFFFQFFFNFCIHRGKASVPGQCFGRFFLANFFFCQFLFLPIFFPPFFYCFFSCQTDVYLWLIFFGQFFSSQILF